MVRSRLPFIMQRSRLLFALMFVALMLTDSSAFGSVFLAPGGGVGLGGATAAGELDLLGLSLRDQLIEFEIRSAAGELLYAGRLQDRVVRSTLTGELHYYSQVRGTNAALPGRIARIDRVNFANHDTYVDYRSDGGGTVAPITANRSAFPGALVRFNFDHSSALGPGERSRLCMIKTDSRDYNVLGQTRLTLTTGEFVWLPSAQPAD